MQFYVKTLTTMCVFLDIADMMIAQDHDALDIVFRQRTRSDWEKVWHHESHTRCRDKLIQHLYWACEKDIYRLSRRNSALLRHANTTMQKRTINVINHPWFVPITAKTLLRSRRSRRRISDGSITAECCTRIGCTWEEYAEYCPTNKRII